MDFIYVYLAAICGHVGNVIVKTLSAFLDACYLAHHTNITDTTLSAFKSALNKFYTHWEIFQHSGVCPNRFSVPCQHSNSHYPLLIQESGTQGGVYSPITKSHHITAVKRPWWCSNHYEALWQILLMNQCLDKLAAAWVDLIDWGMLPSAIFQSQNYIQVASRMNRNREYSDDEKIRIV